jgi:hypothetical protein
MCSSLCVTCLSVFCHSLVLGGCGTRIQQCPNSCPTKEHPLISNCPWWKQPVLGSCCSPECRPHIQPALMLKRLRGGGEHLSIAMGHEKTRHSSCFD